MHDVIRRDLSNEQLVARASSVGQVSPHHATSDRYSFISTLDVVDTLRDDGWRPFSAQQGRIYYSDKGGYQKHMVRLVHPDWIYKDMSLQALLINSHDRSTVYQLRLGIFTFVCANGLISGETLIQEAAKHINQTQEAININAHEMTAKAERIISFVDRFKSVTLDEIRQREYAEAVMAFLYGRDKDGKVKASLTYDQLLETRRTEQSEPTLWNVLNRVQENVVRGGLRGKSFNTGRAVVTQGITAIDRTVDVNEFLWDTAVKFSQ